MDLHRDKCDAGPDEDAERGGKHVVHRIGDHAEMLFSDGLLCRRLTRACYWSQRLAGPGLCRQGRWSLNLWKCHTFASFLLAWPSSEPRPDR